MNVTRSLLLPAAFLAILGGCHKSDDAAPAPQPPAPLPTGNATTTVTTGTTTAVTVTVGGTTVTMPPATTTALTTLASGNVTVAVSQNDTTKQTAAGLAAIPLPTGASSTAVWTWDAAKATPLLEDTPANQALLGQTISITFPATSGRGYAGAYLAGVSTGAWMFVRPTGTGNTITFTFTVDALPVKFMGREYWTSTSIN